MKRYLKFLTLLATIAVWIVPAWSQTVYKCGHAYNQQPCPGATTVDVSDARTPAQRAEAAAATTSTGAMAAKLENERLLREKIAASRSNKKLAHHRTGVKSGASVSASKAAARKKKEAEYFTATAAAAKKEKKNEKKPTDKSQIGKAVSAAKDDHLVKP